MMPSLLSGYLAQVAPGMALTALLWVVGSVLFALALLREGARYSASSTADATEGTEGAEAAAASADASASADADEREGRVA